MEAMLIKMGAEVCAQNYADLVQAWKHYKKNPAAYLLIGRFRVRGRLTDRQRKRLHTDLRRRLVEGWNGE